MSPSAGHGSHLPAPQGLPRTSLWSPVNIQECATRVHTHHTDHMHTLAHTHAYVCMHTRYTHLCVHTMHHRTHTCK